MHHFTKRRTTDDHSRFQPFLVRTGVATQEEVSQLYTQMQADMLKDDFRALMFPLTAWGEKSLRLI